MPIFEEKLICPLAVRFSQDHIRPEFQKGPDMECTIKSIKTKPGNGDYDVILVPPFPNIEIIRSHLKSGTSDHWLSLDNRRLYCLQRAAIAHWPKRVAVEVEALRAPTQGMYRKVTSSVDGLSVGIGHSPKLLTGCWDWHEQVKGFENEIINALVQSDDAKRNIQDLADAPAPPSMLDLFFQNEKAQDSSDTSTAEPQSPRSSEGSGGNHGFALLTAIMQPQHKSEDDWRPDIVGCWSDGNGNCYDISEATHESWTCMQKSVSGARKKYTLWYDSATDSISWGENWSCWADSRDIRYDTRYLCWYAGADAKKRNPHYQWTRAVTAKKDSANPKRRTKHSQQWSK